MDELVHLTHKIEAEPLAQGGDIRTQTGLNTETLTHEPVEDQTQSAMDSALASAQLEAEPPTQEGDCHTQTGLITETLTHEHVEVHIQSDLDAALASTQLEAETPNPGGDIRTQIGLNTETLTHEHVEGHTQSDMDTTVAQTQKIEIETLTQLRDAETQPPEKETMARIGVEPPPFEIPTQAGDAEDQTQDHVDLQNHSNALLQVACAISGVSADSSPEVLAKILQERWQEKEAETQRLREELKRTTEGKTSTQTQVKNLISAACSVSDATEESTPEDATQKLLEARKSLDVWRSDTQATWRERFRIMKNKMALKFETLADPIRLITGGTDTTPRVLAQTLRQTWDQVQSQNDDLELDLKTATDRVKYLEAKLEAQAQDIKCLATDVGIGLASGINHHSDVVFELRQSFDDLQKEVQDLEQQHIASRDSITDKNEQIKDLKIKMRDLTSSLEDLQLLLTESKKKEKKKKSKKLRQRWWKRKPEQQEESNSDLGQMQEDLIKKKATISLLEAKMTTMADQVKKEKDCLERQRTARTELQNDVKLLQFDNHRKETLIQSLRDLVETLKKNCLKKNRGAARYQVRNTVDHATVISMPAIKCEVLDVEDVLPFSGSQKPGDLGSMRVLGKGTYGKVYLGRHGDDLRPIAIKQPLLQPGCPKNLLQEEKQLMKETVMKESMMQQLLSGSPYFPKLFGMVTIGEDLCTVMDFIGNMKTGKTYPLYGALTRFMPNPTLDLINMLQVCEDIIEGMMELHQKGYLHNDLKSNNVLLEKRSQRWHAVIIDLGLVSTMAYSNQRRFSNKKRAEYRAGRGCYYLAPEVVLYGKRFSVASDIFSFGVLLDSIARKIQVDEVAELALICMKQDPLKRPHTMEEILRKLETIGASYYY